MGAGEGCEYLLYPNRVCGASRDVQKVQKVSRRCPEGVQKMSRRCPEGWKRMWERLEGPLQVCRRPQVFYRRSHSVRLSRRSHVSQRVASTSEQPSQSWALKSRHCGLLVKACGPSGHSGHSEGVQKVSRRLLVKMQLFNLSPFEKASSPPLA